MEENRALQRPVYVQKADMALADIVAGGKLVADQRKQFILVNIKGQVVMARIRVTTMSRESEQIPKMTTFGTQVWYPGTESQALSLAQRSKPGFDMVTLTSKEVVCQVDYPRHVLADQVEGPAFHNTLIGYLGLHTKRDFENLIINGDATTPSANSLLAMFDGLLNGDAGVPSNTYAAGGVALSSDILATTIATMPVEYRVQPNLLFLTNPVACDAYASELESRVGAAADARMANGGQLSFRGRPVVEVPLFPDQLGLAGNQTDVWYGDLKQFIFAFHENVELQSEYNIRERTWTVVVTARVAQAFEHEPATVLTTGILGA